jgi:Flp pilus assembly protein TadD
VDPRYGHADVVEADLGLWHLLEGDLSRAADHLQRAIGLEPTNVRARHRQVALAGLAGDPALAREALAAIRDLGGTMDEQYMAASYPFQEPRHAETFRKGLAKAGVGRVGT